VLERLSGAPVEKRTCPEAIMTDTTIKKVSSATSPVGKMGQTYLISGKRVSMRLWRDEEPQADKPSAARDYETVGYVIAGRAELTLEGQTLRLEPGDSWLVPAGAEHSYRILERFTAVEATSRRRRCMAATRADFFSA
jgi:mannose-6-phosphate isomerase-like protein (cupin superfamily)